jgi:hypothetical protein
LKAWAYRTPNPESESAVKLNKKRWQEFGAPATSRLMISHEVAFTVLTPANA